MHAVLYVPSITLYSSGDIEFGSFCTFALPRFFAPILGVDSPARCANQLILIWRLVRPTSITLNLFPCGDPGWMVDCWCVLHEYLGRRVLDPGNEGVAAQTVYFLLGDPSRIREGR